MDADGNNKRRLSDGSGYAGQPSWSPDGKTLVYVHGGKPDIGTPKELYVVPVAGSPTMRVALDNPRGSLDVQIQETEEKRRAG